MSTQVADERVRRLIADFPRFLQAYIDNPPFNREGQQEHHRATIQARRALGSVEAALADDDFIRSLYRTLQAWGIGARASTMLQENDFARVLRGRAEHIAQFEGMRIDDPALHVSAVSDALWRTIRSLGIVSNEANIVPGTKALHHILPELVVPVDRAYTQRFFDLHNPQFQYGQEKVFRRFFATFARIAGQVDLEQYVGEGWNTSRTKVIDNAIIGLLLEEARGAR